LFRQSELTSIEHAGHLVLIHRGVFLSRTMLAAGTVQT